MRHHHKPELHIGKQNLDLSSDITSFSPNLPSLCHHEHFSNNPSQISPLSSPHNTPTMTLPYPSFPTPFASKFLTSNLFTRFRFLILLPLPSLSLYFLVSNPSPLDFFSVIAFSVALFISLNLALPRLPSICMFFTRSLPTNLSSSSSSSSSPVVWSIGSKPNQVKNKTSGCWVQVYSNGDVYEGEFHMGKCWGSGVYHYHMSGRYEGDWVDGKYDGYGVETWARGSRYRGQYRQGLRHGIGIYRFYSGDVFAGEWSNGQCHGFGVHTCSDGSRYVGEFKWGVKHGLGQYHFRNGDIYAGEYFADKMHGFGVYQFQNGHQYEGAWHEGRRQGLGRYTFRNGETQCGHWQNGILDGPKRQNNCTGSPCAVDHAKVLNAVQDAHCAAEKAHNMANLDDGVNKVAAAANKAANAARVAAVKAVQSSMHHNNNNNNDK
ncbi:MORN repeat-containing protein 1-like [Abrus precatorius]|uniref:MORN repeat-containing protein 1-like n=1 Tax=Abrus precatorius TaxID=3816 RepID=A0A8B8JWX7_ABRPR|nr:MORN repeat-containing protein 1-like [Abrus precatorius]